MTKYDLKILREVAGLEKPSQWGAAVSASLSFLARNGYITTTFGGVVTEKGQQAIDNGGAVI